MHDEVLEILKERHLGKPALTTLSLIQPAMNRPAALLTPIVLTNRELDSTPSVSATVLMLLMTTKPLPPPDLYAQADQCTAMFHQSLEQYE
jgi:hypothetical protein